MKWRIEVLGTQEMTTSRTYITISNKQSYRVFIEIICVRDLSGYMLRSHTELVKTVHSVYNRHQVVVHVERRMFVLLCMCCTVILNPEKRRYLLNRPLTRRLMQKKQALLCFDDVQWVVFGQVQAFVKLVKYTLRNVILWVSVHQIRF